VDRRAGHAGVDLMLHSLLAALVIGYVPGALIYRLPIADRARRAALDAEERAFWHVLISLAWSLGVALALAVADRYAFDHLLFANSALCLALALAGRRGLAYRGTAARMRWTVVIPIALVALGVWRFFPSSEFVIGGQDPGVYMNEGIQIAQRGGIVTHDRLVADLPAPFRDLFIPPNVDPDAPYYGLRFMGFFVRDPADGSVIGQFPHLYPASIAVGYGLNGLSGARQATGVWAILGVLAVYVAGVRLVGRAAASAAALLLSLHVIVAWYAKAPNAEVLMMTLVFGATLAFARAHRDDDRFFAPVAAVLVALLFFHRSDSLMVLAGFCGAALLLWLAVGQRPRTWFVLPLAAGAVLGWSYLTGPLRAYLSLPQVYLANLPIAGVAGGAAAAITGAGALVWLRRRDPDAARAAIPAGFVFILLIAAAYALFLRQPGGKLTDYDAYALRTFADFYLTWPALVAALVGLVIVARRDFWRDPALMLVFAGFAIYFFYKIRIVPNHFWASRRFLPVILPVSLLFAAAAAVGPWRSGGAVLHALRVTVGAVFLAALGVHYAAASAPVVRHVEYAGVIPYLETLAGRFGDRDLVLVESRNVVGSDMHVLALPLGYIYAKHVLVLASAVPETMPFESFLAWAFTRYDRVSFLGGGGTDLLSRRVHATPMGGDTVQVPEYDSPWNDYPDGPRFKEFDYSIYALSLGERAAGPFVLDVGFQDDLNVVRFHAKESTADLTFRWTGPQSFVAVPGLAGSEREVTLVMHDGGRPTAAEPARVDVFFDDLPLGSIDVGSGFQAYRLPLPAGAAEAAARRDAPARLRVVSTTWRPSEFLGGSDGRELGVMVDRVEIR
jgi:hypothetical protein